MGLFVERVSLQATVIVMATSKPLIIFFYSWLLPLFALQPQSMDFLNKNIAMTEDKVLVQGDMVVTLEQFGKFYGGRTGRKATYKDEYLWPNGEIPYKLSTQSKLDKDVIKSALQVWMDRTCVKFKEIKDYEKAPNYLYFVRENGCWSSVGMVDIEQKISIGPGCDKEQVIMHEVGHALGFHHEQSRSDRDSHVVLFLENVDPDMRFNFKKEQDKNYSVEYDYTSLMHYQLNGYSIDPFEVRTLMPKNPLDAYLITEKSGLSFRDIKLANLMYKCGSHCSNSLTCYHGGYIGSDCACKCPPGTRGRQCENKFRDYYPPNVCGEMVRSERIISSPGFPDQQKTDITCIWWIQAPYGKRVRLVTKAFELENRYVGTGNTMMHKKCIWDKLDIRTDNLYMGTIYCGEEIKKGEIFTSSDRDLVLEYHAMSPYRKGFQFNVEFLPAQRFNADIGKSCGSSFKMKYDVSYHVTTPKYPDNYKPETKCEYTFWAPSSTDRLSLRFYDFIFEKSLNCSKDNVTIESLVTGDTHVFCGEDLKKQNFVTKGGFLRIVVNTDKNEQYPGFRMKALVERPPCGGQASPSKKISVSLSKRDIANDKHSEKKPADCEDVMLRVNTKGLSNVIESEKFCGSDIPETIVSDENNLFLFISGKPGSLSKLTGSVGTI
ncbi:blastula protease 10-like isoform X2 [Tachypleus tridentatus]|uniref:blastula protease 10-like isoform X2 n=1 Tax=Tachypleus tridentatus TaxID=6853 RepID=UPI003FD671FC